jgi:hypothetical protein
MGIVMAQVHFGQPFLKGIIKLRQNFNFLLFFILMSSVYSERDLTFFVKGMSVIVCIVGVLSLIQYVFPKAPIFIGQEIDALYSGTKLLRYGEYRIIFPAASLAVLFYFYVLGDIIKTEKPNNLYLKCAFLMFLFSLFYIQQTRARILPLIVVTIYGLFRCKKRFYKITATVIFFLFVCIQLFSFAISNKGLLSFQDSKIYKMVESVTNAFDTDESSINARFNQVDMYLEYFKRYPILGAGTLEIISPLSKKYQLYNTSDLGYFKLLCEYGIVGSLWLCWLFIYIYRRTKKILNDNFLGGGGIVAGITQGTRLFYIYIAISMLTLPHFARGGNLLYMMISIALLEIVYRLWISSNTIQKTAT